MSWLANLFGLSPAALIGRAAGLAAVAIGAWLFVSTAFDWRAERDAAQLETSRAVQRNVDLVAEQLHQLADIELQRGAELHVYAADAIVLPAIATLTERIRRDANPAEAVPAALDDALDRVLRITGAGPGGLAAHPGADSVRPDSLRYEGAPAPAAAVPARRRPRGEVDAWCVDLAGWVEGAWIRAIELRDLDAARAAAEPGS